MNKIKITLGLLLFSILGFASNDRPELTVSNIPDSLKKNAYAVIRFSNIEYNYKTIDNATEKHSIAVTILDKKGMMPEFLVA